MRRILMLAFATLAAASVSAGTILDSTQVLGDERNTSDSGALVSAGAQVRFTVPGFGPVILDGTLYTAFNEIVDVYHKNGHVLAHDVGTGQLIKRFDLAPNERVAQLLCERRPRGEKVVYVITSAYDDATFVSGVVYALQDNGPSFSVLWRRVRPGVNLDSWAALGGGRLVMAMSKGDLRDGLVALSTDDGHTVFTLRMRWNRMSKPAVDAATGRIYLHGDVDTQGVSLLVGLDAQGRRVLEVRDTFSISSAPVLSEDGRRLYLQHWLTSTSVRCLDAFTGALLWDSDSSGISAEGRNVTPVLSHGMLYAYAKGLDGSVDSVAALDAGTGALIWRTPVADVGNPTRMIATSGLLWTRRGSGDATYLLALDAATGAVRTDILLPGASVVTVDLAAAGTALYTRMWAGILKLE